MLRSPARRPPACAQGGFTYLVLLFAIALSGAALALAGTYWSQERQREKEADLLFIGDQYRRAIANYYERSPGSVKRYPQQIEELVYDKRFLTTQRHLRRAYADPITGNSTWGLVKAPDGGIMGVYSLSQAQPLKTGNFRGSNEPFRGAKKISDWRFVYEPQRQRGG